MTLIELKSGEKRKPVTILEKSGSKMRIQLGEKEYDIDVEKVEKNIYSILCENRSYNMKVVPSGKKNRYSVRYVCYSYDVEVVDPETRYTESRKRTSGEDGENVISSPMSGKIVRVMVKKGDEVKPGQVVIVVSAMKMESEYKCGKAGIVKDVLVSEGDVVGSDTPLIILE